MARRPDQINSRHKGPDIDNEMARRLAVSSCSWLYLLKRCWLVDIEMARRPAESSRSRLYQIRRSRLWTMRWPGDQLLSDQ